MRQIDAEPIIKNLSAMKTQLSYDAIDIDGMIKALRDAETIDAAQPPNDPLTLEELREMDGEPVFIKRIGSDHPDDRAWALVDVEHELCKTADGVKAFFEFYGKSWLAYRHKPEGGTT